MKILSYIYISNSLGRYSIKLLAIFSAIFKTGKTHLTNLTECFPSTVWSFKIFQNYLFKPTHLHVFCVLCFLSMSETLMGNRRFPFRFHTYSLYDINSVSKSIELWLSGSWTWICFKRWLTKFSRSKNEYKRVQYSTQSNIAKREMSLFTQQ